MRPRAWAACLGGALGLAAAAWGAPQAGVSETRPVGGAEMEELRRYGQALGKDLLRQGLGLDLDALTLRWDRDLGFRTGADTARAGEGRGGEGEAPTPLSDLRRRLSLRLEQSDDLLRLQQDLRDIPFGLSVDGQLPLLDSRVLETRLWLPFSWRDEFRARASLPLLPGTGGVMGLTLRSDYRNHLGMSSVEAGLGTLLRPEGLGLWAVDYDFQQRFGQGTHEAIHWLKFSRSF